VQKPRVITALITPFLNGEVDLNGLRDLLARQLEGGIEGILVLGTTGESPTLTKEERKTVISTTVEFIGGRIPVLAGTGTNCTQTTIELTKEAQELGADIALVVTPYYNCPTQNGIFEHFSAVCRATHIPICIYNIPKRTGRIITVDTLKRLAALPNIIGVKESTGDVSQSSQIMRQIGAYNDNFTLWSGDDALTLPIMSVGGHGVISVASNIAPRQIREMVEAASSGDYETARQYFFNILPLLDVLFIETNPIPVKAAMEFCGMPSGSCRLPLGQLSPENQQKLQETLIECGIFSPQLR
jgi:4-hydroxy-tetrahydrodipicolinate synthase